jgi:hypothetical protein
MIGNTANVSANRRVADALDGDLIMDQRERFIQDERPALYSMTEFSARYRISRRTAHKWLARFDEEGRAGLRDRSRAPHHCPHRIEREVAQVIVARAAPTRHGVPRSCLIGSGRPRSSPCRRPVPQAISWRAAAW